MEGQLRLHRIEPIEFGFDNVRLFGRVHYPNQDATRGKHEHSGVVLCHGFSGASYPDLVWSIVNRDIVVLEFSFRGYGKSGGEPGRVICDEQAEDAGAAIAALSQLEGIDRDRIGVVGSSLGGSVAMMAVAKDDRIKVCVAGCPVANGVHFLQAKCSDDASWARLNERMSVAMREGARVGRFEIVDIPEKLRGNLPPGTPMDFSPATFFSIRDIDLFAVLPEFKRKRLLLLHARDDQVVPIDGTNQLAAAASSASCEYEVFDEGNHFIFAQPPVARAITEWLSSSL